MLFTRPTHTIPISVTGATCALNCAHCGGVYLQHMRTPDALETGGAKSVLISGGCDSAGRVPVTEHLAAIQRLREAGLRLNWHVGFISEVEADAIKPLVDVISLDVVGAESTARRVYGIDHSLDDYMGTLDMLLSRCAVVPHVTLGLDAGEIVGEYAALEALAQRKIEKLVLIVLIPTRGTRFANVTPPSLEEIGDLFTRARELLPATRIYLGCMRPHGVYRQQLDELALTCGLDGITNPTQAAERLAERMGLPITWGDECCALL